MAKSKKPKPKAAEGVKVSATPQHNIEDIAPTTFTEEGAEHAFVDLPGRVHETLAVVRYTGRKRAYIHYGRAGRERVFWYLIRSDGPRLLKLYPTQRAEECFAELLGMIEGWRASVDSSPMSDSYCEVCPDESVIEQVIRSKYLADLE